ncbi:hypothetical protein CH63R_07794 [Colletotrichum higginsianum IMI 349063]|uniref:RING-type domain-containing protein n=1 Tax=Colletotrichum higginsianum (strain IMI 349063) TaxID=759273 RepID=A0A1B7YAI1_COLHI|nr:hypothetical protein CH63R_07794 [Colletotrichum higginsianum IMI 349063]OBR09029.1 hypothetical protein CH63R_07794 [Colletotrichum higginsianum IMI 349063]
MVFVEQGPLLRFTAFSLKNEGCRLKAPGTSCEGLDSIIASRETIIFRNTPPQLPERVSVPMVMVPGIERAQRRYLSTRRYGSSENCSRLRQAFPPFVNDWLRPIEPKFSDVERCFFPSPKTMFLIDQPEGLVCQICQHSKLSFQNHADKRTDKLPDSVPAIMPCGHVAGVRCLTTWLRDHQNCPFCRQELIHSKCGHGVAPRHITMEEIFLIPATIPEGGLIPELCPRCYATALRTSAEARFDACKRRFVQARRRFFTSESQADARFLMHKKTDFENIMLEEYYAKITNTWLTCW